MAKTRAKLHSLLDTLAEQTPALVMGHSENADFWSRFASASDFILDDAGSDQFEWVRLKVDRILQASGRLPSEPAPSDDLPPA